MTSPAPPSGFYLANRFGLIFLEAMEEAVGRNGLNALLNLSDMGRFVDQRPPDSLDRGFDLACVSNLQRSLEMVYGPHGARGLALRGGRAMCDRILEAFDLQSGLNELAFRLMPVPSRLKAGVPALAKVISQHSDQICQVSDRGQHFEFHVQRCANCWGHQAPRPLCYFYVGLLQEALSVFGRGQEFRVIQTECRAAGASACVFTIEKNPIV